MDDFYNDLINEVLMSDVSTKGWAEFEKKYLPLAGRKDLFCQFTQFGASTDDKRMVGAARGIADEPLKPGQYFTPKGSKSAYEVGQYYPEGSGKKSNMIVSDHDRQLMTPDMTLWTKPNHNDPTAIYTYPLDFVVHHQTGIPYGFNSRFMRIIKLRPGAKVLDLQSLTKQSAIALLKRMGIADAVRAPDLDESKDKVEQLWDLAVKHGTTKFSPYPVTAPKVFFLLAQAGEWIPSKWETDDGAFSTTSNNLQAGRFLRAGIEVVQDTATTADAAVIHSNEPEQCFFMSRGAFDIVDVFEIGRTSEKSYQREPQVWSWDRAQDKIVANIVQTIDPKDQIIKKDQVYGGIEAMSNPYPLSGTVSTKASWVATTKRGRAVEISAKALGGGSLRNGGRHIDVEYGVEVAGEFGHLSDRFTQDDELQPAIARVAQKARQAPVQPEWKGKFKYNAGAEYWRRILKSAVDYNQDSVDIDALKEQGQHFVVGLTTLFSNVGWSWEAPTDPWDCVGCMIAANHVFQYALRRDGMRYAYTRGMSTIRDQMAGWVSGNERAPITQRQMDVLKGTPVEDPALSMLAGSFAGEFRGDKQFIKSLAHGMEILFQKRWAEMMHGAYPNYREGMPENMARLIETTTAEAYEETCRAVWMELVADKVTEIQKRFYEHTGTHPKTEWVRDYPVSEVIIGNRFSLDNPSVPVMGGSMPTKWKDGTEAPFEAPSKPSPGKDPVMAKAKNDVQKVLKRHLTWQRDPKTKTETAYIGHGRKVRLGVGEVTGGPMVICLQADKMPADLPTVLGV